MPPPAPLSGLNAAVVGASSGIGRAVAARFAELGADVLVHAGKNHRGLDTTAQRVETTGRASQRVLVDLSKSDGPAELVEAAWAWRPIDLWFHAAGADVLTGEQAKLGFEQKLDLLWRVDVRAAMLACRAIGERMRERGGVILTLGWDQAETGMEGDSGEMFAAIKGAVMAFTRSLARSLAPDVRVNAIAPGWVRTKWGEDAPEPWRRRAVEESLVGRWGEPEDIAAAAAYLASPEASFVTGQVLNVNGGFRGSQRGTQLGTRQDSLRDSIRGRADA